jgi:predicted dehydrogenase
VRPARLLLRTAAEERPVHSVLIVGCGFVADLYMRSLKRHPEISVGGVFDIDAARLAAFTRYWSVPAAPSYDALLAARSAPRPLVLNLANPRAHFEVTRRALDAGFDVYSEKPLAMTLEEAKDLAALAGERGLILASAPCSFLSEAAQTLIASIQSGRIGAPKLVYAELDDGYIPDAPYSKWASESGAPWPARDEFEVGCTLEHAGYALSWLMAAFGPIARIAAASAILVPEKLPAASAPDFSSGVLFFANGVVARLTCSILAPHDHQLQVIGSKGRLVVADCWNNGAAVRLKRRMTLRRRLIESPIGERVRLQGASHPKVGRWGSASMNFALGPAEILAARAEGRRSRMEADFALHLTEATLALQESGAGVVRAMATTFTPPEPMPWAVLAGTRE